MTWEAIFLLGVLKIPVIYVCLVAWWAIRAEPKPGEGPQTEPVRVPPENDPRPGTRLWDRARRPQGGGPHGRPVRTFQRREAFARARVTR